MSVQTVQQHPASVDAYIRYGWSLVPIPPGTKGPRQSGWNKRENALKSQQDLPPGYGIGLAHAYSGTMALDIDDWSMTKGLLALSGIDLDALYAAPDAVIIDSGRQGRGKLLYAMPQALPSKKVSSAGGAIYELRCATSSGLTVQDVLPPSIHPETLQPYRWAGRGHWSRLPTIPESLLTLWRTMLEEEQERTIRTDTTVNASWSEIKDALEHISPDVSRDEWISIGMALHWASKETNTEEGLSIWDDWSAQSETKYPGQREIANQWRSFNSSKANQIKLGTLYHIAKGHGWVRPLPDVSALFSSIAQEDLLDVTMALRPPAPTINIDLFPAVLAQRAREIEVSTACDPIIPLFAGMAAVCGAVDAQMRLELMEGWKVPPVLWLMIIGEPAGKKTPASAPMFETLQALQMEDKPRQAKEMLIWEGAEAAHAAQKKHYLEFAASPEALVPNAALPQVQDLPPQPVPLRLIVSDVTSQKLIRQAADRPRGLLCYLDEMASWTNKLSDPKSGEDRSAWVQSYEARPYDMDRVGGGSIHADNLAISIYGNIQPTVFHQAKSRLAADGLLQRFIPGIVDEKRRGLNNPLPAYMTNTAVWDQTVRIAFSLPVHTYRLSPEAYATFREFQLWYDQRKHDERLLMSSDTFMTAFGKLEGLVGRIALVMHIIEAPFCPTVNERTMTNATLLVKSYIVPALRYAFDDIGQGAIDRWVSEYILQNYDRCPQITLSDLKRSARRQLEQIPHWAHDNAIYSAMAPLEQAGWCKRVDDGSQEHRRIAIWAINPAIGDKFRAQRKAVIDAKQRRMDEIYETNPKPTIHLVHGSDDSKHRKKAP